MLKIETKILYFSKKLILTLSIVIFIIGNFGLEIVKLNRRYHINIESKFNINLISDISKQLTMWLLTRKCIDYGLTKYNMIG